jgi:hypothetical protein
MSERKFGNQEIPGQMVFGDTGASVDRDDKPDQDDRENEVFQKLEQIFFHTSHPDQEKEKMGLEEYYLFTADRSLKDPEKYLSVYEPIIADKIKNFLDNSEIEIVANAFKRKLQYAKKELELLKARLEKAESKSNLDSQPYYGEDSEEIKQSITSQIEKTEKLNALIEFLMSIIEAI